MTFSTVWAAEALDKMWLVESYKNEEKNPSLQHYLYGVATSSYKSSQNVLREPAS